MKDTSYTGDVLIYKYHPYLSGEARIDLLYINGKFIWDANVCKPIDYGATYHESYQLLQRIIEAGATTNP